MFHEYSSEFSENDYEFEQYTSVCGVKGDDHSMIVWMH